MDSTEVEMKIVEEFRRFGFHGSQQTEKEVKKLVGTGCCWCLVDSRRFQEAELEETGLSLSLGVRRGSIASEGPTPQ